jgi:protein-S-isoprenylcysteine O-methyltransferase Ste14
MIMLALWSTPWLSMGHLVLSIVLTAYVILAVLLLEEADLIKEFGDQYRQYKKRVPAFIPYRGIVAKLE